MSSEISTETVSRRLGYKNTPGRQDSTVRPSSLQPWSFFVVAALVAATAAILLSRLPLISAIMISLTIGAAALGALAFYRMLSPLVAPEVASTDMVGGWTRVALEREKALVLRSLKELEFDRAMGKMSEADFHDMAGRLRSRALGLMRQLDSGSGYREVIEQELTVRLANKREGDAATRTTTATAGASTAPAASIELETGGRQASETETLRCRRCTTDNEADARFCKQCGSKLR